jgi:hypothetical protein
MYKNKTIFNFVSNSYSQFLSRSQSSTPSSTKQPLGSTEEIKHQTDFLYGIYLQKKNINSIHQGLFFGFSILFFILFSIIYFSNTNWACSVFFSQCAYIKPGVYGFCFLLATGSALIGYYSNPEKEAAYFLINRMEKKLKASYKRKQLETNYFSSIFHPEKRIKRKIYKQNYQQALNKIREYKENITHHINHIINLKEENLKTKEKLIKDAFYDLNHQLNCVLQSFKDSLSSSQ